MTDSLAPTRTIEKVQPDEVYNLDAQSHVARTSTWRSTTRL
jgi:GDP-D-mannose dehydratase